jgi:iron complex transport system substrate-binding protein
MRSLRLAASAALAVGVLLSGCGSPSTSAGSPADTGSSAAVVPSGLPPKPYQVVEGRSEVTENPDGTRTVKSSWGTATVPAKPARIVTILGYVDFETMLALGVKPVGAGTQGGPVASGFAPHLSGVTAGVEPLDWSQGAPVEKIAALRPDLIFAPDQDSYNAVKDLAPTVAAGAADDLTWKDDARYVATVLGRAGQAEKLITDYETRASALRAKLQPVMTGKTVASPQVTHDRSQVTVSGDNAFASAVMQEAGLTLAPILKGSDSQLKLSFENLADLNADVLFWQVRQDDKGARDTAALDVVTKSPLWSKLPAVRTGQVHQVDNRPWYFPTILSAEQMLTDIDKALLS